MEAEPELLARHCTEAGLAERAIDYWQHAGERAIKRFANLEAVAHFRRALEMMEVLPNRVVHAEQELQLLLAFGSALVDDAVVRRAGDRPRLRPRSGAGASNRSGRRNCSRQCWAHGWSPFPEATCRPQAG